MKNESLNTLLDTLYEITGIHFSCDSDDSTVSDESIREIISRLRTKLTPAQVIDRYINGFMSYDEILTTSHEIHFNIPEYIDLIIISFETEITREAQSVLNSLYDNSSSVTIKKDDKTLLLIHSTDSITPSEDFLQVSRSIIDTLSMEAMINATIAFDRSCSLEELPVIYQHTEMAMRIGRIFKSHETVYNYHDLGLGKLLYNLPRESCENFLKDSLPDVDFSKIDKETLNIINTFLESGLNIAEASRMLYMHRNTLVYRLDKFSKQTNLDIKSFDDAILFRLGMMINTYLNN
jgi:carbohydrate diacid regulator